MSSDIIGKGSIAVGELVGLFALQGWLKVVSWCEPQENILTYKHWQLVSPKTNEQLSVEVGQGKLHRGGRVLVVKLKGIDDIRQAETLVGHQIYINKELLPFKENEFYWFELLGMQVINQHQELLGTVDSLLETGKHDVLQIKCRQKSYLIPYVWDRVIKNIDREQGLIEVDWSSEWLGE